MCKNSLSGTVQIWAIYTLHHVYFILWQQRNKNKFKLSPLPKPGTSSQSATNLKRKSVSPFAQVSSLQPALLRSPSPLQSGWREWTQSPGRPFLLSDTSRQSWKNNTLKSPLHFHSAPLLKATLRAMSSKTLRTRRSSTSFATRHP